MEMMPLPYITATPRNKNIHHLIGVDEGSRGMASLESRRLAAIPFLRLQGYLPAVAFAAHWISCQYIHDIDASL
jgi:hypothetical protein